MHTKARATATSATLPESVESLRAQRDLLADFIRQLAADNPRTMALDAQTHRTALELLDDLPTPERCPNAETDDPGDGHTFVLPTDNGTRCLNCRSLRPKVPAVSGT
ncbi:hypothetical protein ABZ851_30615 [Streptomyces sp. NPDC047049]|uniref:hypothetical protein n=1 Tax=Streptomyces sp. NPDC047049 TaxID=3156688 RepID=UPI0033C722A5